MKRQKFINAENLPELARAFALAVDPVLNDSPDAELNISLIGEPGVGKSYISGKLSEAVLGEHTLTRITSVPRDNMHDLILWSVRESDTLQIVQYDEASLRYVDSTYHDFVTQQRKQYPVPQREKPGITFAEHPDHETEEKSDIVMRLSFSHQQAIAMKMLHELINPFDLETTNDIKKDIARVAAQGCLLEMEFQEGRVNTAPLIEFFDTPEPEPSKPEHANARQDDEPEPEFV